MTDAELTARLSATTRYGRLLHLSRCTSTQDVAAAEDGDVCVWSDAQDQGRGRQGRTWEGAAGLDVEATFRSIGPRLADPSPAIAVLPTAVLVALEGIAGRSLTLKWPNDVLVDGRKLCGLLIDAPGAPPGTWLVGVGVNVNRTDFPAALRERATSLALLCGRRFDRGEVLLALAQELDAAFRMLAAGRLDDYAARFRASVGLVGRRVTIAVGSEPSRERRVTAIDLRRVHFDDGRSIDLGAVSSLRG